MLADVRNTLSLSWSLFGRTIGAKYRRSFLGYFWMVAPALVVSAGACVAYDSGLLRPGDTTLPYALFVFIGTLLWQTFAETATLAHQAIEGARSYLTRVQFPREAIILAQACEAFFVTCVRVFVALLFMALTGTLSLSSAGTLLFCAFLAALLGLGISMITMPFTILFSDLHQTIKLILSYGIFLTPAMYLPAGDGLFALVVRNNPISPLMQVARDVAAGVAISTPTEFYVVIAVSIFVTCLGIALVRISTPIIVERMLIGGR